MRRIALFSDIHGNAAALDDVLEDIRAHGITEQYCLGDLIGYNREPTPVTTRIRELRIPTVRGNCDEGAGAAVPAADRKWLAGLPGQLRFEHHGTRVLLTHGSPRRINEYLTLDISDYRLLSMAEDAGADVVCVGHAHVPYHRKVTAPSGKTLHFICAGSVGKPRGGIRKATWVELILGDNAEVDSAVHTL